MSSPWNRRIAPSLPTLPMGMSPLTSTKRSPSSVRNESKRRIDQASWARGSRDRIDCAHSSKCPRCRSQSSRSASTASWTLRMAEER